jgi:hypothetical protein
VAAMVTAAQKAVTRRMKISPLDIEMLSSYRIGRHAAKRLPSP